MRLAGAGKNVELDGTKDAKVTLLPLHRAQVVTYLRLLNLPHGLIINFNTRRLTDGVRSILK